MSDKEESFVCMGIAWVSEGSVLTARHLSHTLSNRLFPNTDSDDAQNAAGGQEVIFLHRNQQQKLKMPVYCVVHECSNRFNKKYIFSIIF